MQGKYNFNEPSMVALAVDKVAWQKILAVGQAAQQCSKTRDKLKLIRPMKDGVIADFQCQNK